MKGWLFVILLVVAMSYLTLLSSMAQNKQDSIQKRECLNLIRKGLSEANVRHYQEAEVLFEQAINQGSGLLPEEDVYTCYNHLAQTMEAQNKLEVALNIINKYIELMENAEIKPTSRLYTALSDKERILRKLGRYIEAANAAEQSELSLSSRKGIRCNIRPYADKLNEMIKSKWQSALPECACAIHITIGRDGDVKAVESVGDKSGGKNCIDVIRSMHFDPLPDWYKGTGLTFEISTQKKQ